MLSIDSTSATPFWLASAGRRWSWFESRATLASWPCGVPSRGSCSGPSFVAFRWVGQSRPCLTRFSGGQRGDPWLLASGDSFLCPLGCSCPSVHRPNRGRAGSAFVPIGCGGYCLLVYRPGRGKTCLCLWISGRAHLQRGVLPLARALGLGLGKQEAVPGGC